MTTTQATPLTLTPDQAAEKALSEAAEKPGHGHQALNVAMTTPVPLYRQDGLGFNAFAFIGGVSEADLPSLQAKVLSVGSGWDAYMFALHVLGADIPALQARMLSVGVGLDAVLFARDVPGADFFACQKRVLEFGTGFDAYFYAIKVPGADIAACQARVLAWGTPHDMFRFAMNIHSADVEALYAAAQAQGFNGWCNAQENAEFDARLAEYRAQPRQQTAQADVGVADDAGAAPEAPAA